MKKFSSALRVPMMSVFLITFYFSKAQNLIVNPSAETVLGSEWQVVSAGTSCSGGSGWRMPSLGSGDGYPNAQLGSYFFNPGCGGTGNGANYEIYQDVNVTAHIRSIDANAFQITFSAYLQSFNQSPADQATITVEYRDVNNSTVLSSFTTGATTYTSGWTLFSKTAIVPVGTRTIRIRLIGTSRNGNAIDAYFDNLVLSPVSLLPVNLLSFSAATDKSNVLLNWETTNEVNNKGFQIQTATDGQHWSTIGFVSANTATTAIKSYTYTDKAPAKGANYYRLLQQDVDGRSQISEIRQIKFGGSSSVSIFPNPVKDVMSVRAVSPTATLAIVNAAGGLVARYASKNSIDISSLAPGVYYLKVEDQQYIQMLKFMKL